MPVHLDEILATIRQRESGGNYAAKAPKSSASGAYQFIDSTWQGLLERYQLSGPPRASDAPPALQDYVAARYVADILRDHGGDLRAVPAVWYTGRYDPANLDHVPSPGAGNSLTVRGYVDGWLRALSEHSPGMGGAAGGGGVVVDVADRPATAGPTALDTFLNAAIAQQGDRYVFGHEVDLADRDPETFDCSELVQWAAAQAGIEVTDGSWLQYRQLAGRGAELSIEEALRTPGALLFSFSGDPTSGGRPSRAHVAISLGDGRVMEARNPRVGVLISDASAQRWTHAAAIPELGTEQSAGWPATAPLAEPPAEFGLDSDADGLLDEHERFIGTDPFAPDTDLDGFVDGAELLAHTDPLDATSNVLALAGGTGPAYVPPMTFASTAADGMGQTSSPYPSVQLPPLTPPAPSPGSGTTTPPPTPAPTSPTGPAAPATPGEPATVGGSGAPPGSGAGAADVAPGGAPAPPAPAADDGPAVPAASGAAADAVDAAPSPGGSPSGTGTGLDEALAGALGTAGEPDAAALYEALSATAASNQDLADYLQQLGIDSADELYRLPDGFDVDDWT